MPKAKYDQLVDSIKTHGLDKPIELIGDLIIDGKNRQNACVDAGVKPAYVQVSPDDPADYTYRCNGHRNPYTKQQLAAIAAELANMKDGNPKFTTGSNEPVVSNQDAADLMGVSLASVKRAKKVMREDPEAHEAAKRGDKVKAKQKPKPKSKGVSWTSITSKYGLTPLGHGGISPAIRKSLKEQIISIDPGIEFPSTGVPPDMASRLEKVCAELKRRKDPQADRKEAEKAAAEVSPLLSMSAQQRLETAIRAHKRALDAEHEYHLQKRIKEELNRILPGYRKRDQEHLDTINAYKGVFSRAEYKLVLGLLHSDNLPGIDELRRARYDKAFDLVKRKERWLCGLKESDKVESSLPETVEELLKRRR
jgi:hypothetical protein